MAVDGWRQVPEQEGFMFAAKLDPARDGVMVYVKTLDEAGEKYLARFINYKEYNAQALGEAVDDCIERLKKENPQ